MPAGGRNVVSAVVVLLDWIQLRRMLRLRDWTRMHISVRIGVCSIPRHGSRAARRFRNLPMHNSQMSGRLIPHTPGHFVQHLGEGTPNRGNR